MFKFAQTIKEVPPLAYVLIPEALLVFGGEMSTVKVFIASGPTKTDPRNRGLSNMRMLVDVETGDVEPFDVAERLNGFIYTMENPLLSRENG